MSFEKEAYHHLLQLYRQKFIKNRNKYQSFVDLQQLFKKNKIEKLSPRQLDKQTALSGKLQMNRTSNSYKLFQTKKQSKFCSTCSPKQKYQYLKQIIKLPKQEQSAIQSPTSMNLQINKQLSQDNKNYADLLQIHSQEKKQNIRYKNIGNQSERTRMESFTMKLKRKKQNQIILAQKKIKQDSKFKSLYSNLNISKKMNQDNVLKMDMNSQYKKNCQFYELSETKKFEIQNKMNIRRNNMMRKCSKAVNREIRKKSDLTPWIVQDNQFHDN